MPEPHRGDWRSIVHQPHSESGEFHEFASMCGSHDGYGSIPRAALTISLIAELYIPLRDPAEFARVKIDP